MLPIDLQPAQFDGYPPQARKLAVAHLASLRQLPLSFLPSLLREVIEYDYKFPAERSSIDKELTTIGTFSSVQVKDWFGPFSQFTLSPQLQKFDWVNLPAQFVEQLSAYLWSTHQLDGFRKAAIDYGDRMRAATPPDPSPAQRLGIAIIGQGVASYDAPLFRNLRKHGTYFSRIKSEEGLDLILKAAAERAQAHPVPYGHWYVDGGPPANHDPLLTCVSYQRLEPVRAALLENIQAQLRRPGMGPEELRTHLARLSPSDVGLGSSTDPVLSRFQLKLLTEGSGSQIFATTFAQWTAREVLRRSQPLTLVVRFAPRQRQKPMNEMLSATQGNLELDPVGSLVDADMGAYYNWINQQRLPGAEHSSFLVWFEGHSQALAIGPGLSRGTESSTPAGLAELLKWATA
jgi:hypothetical protein